MTDKFLNRVAQTAGLTVRFLRELQGKLLEVGLPDLAGCMEPVIRDNETVVFDTQDDTDVGRKKRHSKS